MSLAGLDFQAIHLPFTAGLDTKAHAFALDPPGLSSAKNVEFDELGGLRLRKPYASIGADILGGGTLSNVRKLAVVGDELLCFTSTALYSWSESLTKWASRGTHLAVAATEETHFGNPNDQTFADRATLSGITVMVWTEAAPSSELCYLAAFDNTTKVTVIAPTAIGGSTFNRPRVVALSTKILVTWANLLGVYATTIDPASPSFTTAGATAISSNPVLAYDIVKDPTDDRAVYAGSLGTEYIVGRVTAALAATASTKIRAADGLIAVSVSGPDLRITVARQDADDIEADILDLSTLADVGVLVNLAVGSIPSATTTLKQLTCAHRTVQEGAAYRCYVFWEFIETTETQESTSAAGSQQTIESNWIDTGGATGTEANFILRHGIASRAFDHGGQIYLWTVFGKANTVGGAPLAGSAITLGFQVQMQNTCYLFRDDAEFFAKVAWRTAGGFGHYDGHLAGVALTSGSTAYSWATTKRGFIDLSADAGIALARDGYSARTPLDVTFTFDSDDARRVVQIGATAYVSGGLVFQYDGDGLVETGFEQFPYFLHADQGAAGAIPAGAYAYKASVRWTNGRGETERSTTAIGSEYTVAANKKITWAVARLTTTRKQGSRRKMTIEAWRTILAPREDSPFYLVTSRDPADTGDNGYVENDPTGAVTTNENDNLTDADLAKREQHPENGGKLSALAPPPASILLATDVRMFAAGIPGEPYRVYYSLLRNENEIVAFNGDLAIDLPATTGAITGLGFLSDTLVVFTATAVYVLPGEGNDNVGGGLNYGPPRLVSSDVGASSHDTIATTPMGLIFFSRKGWYRLTPGWTLEYVGAKVEDFNSDTWVAAQVVESQHQVRVLSSSRMLVFDYLINEWSEWEQASGRDLALWRGTPMLLDSAVKEQLTTHTGAAYGIDLVTGWIKLAGLQGLARLRRLMVLGEFKNDHAQSVSLGFDYSPTYTDTHAVDFAGLTANGPTQLRVGPSRQRVQAVRLRLQVVAAADDLLSFPDDDPVTLTGLSLEVGMRRGLYPRLPAAQKT